MEGTLKSRKRNNVTGHQDSEDSLQRKITWASHRRMQAASASSSSRTGTKHLTIENQIGVSTHMGMGKAKATGGGRDKGMETKLDVRMK